MMEKDELDIKDALLEASLKRIRLIESMEYPEIKTDENFDKKIYDVIYSNTNNKKRYPKKFTLILVATLTLCFLILFSVSAQVRTSVIDFFVEVYETFASFFIEKDDVQTPTTIDIKYEPKYLRDSCYQKSINVQTKRYIIYTWSRDDENLGFSQYVIDENNITSDIENTEYEVLYIGEQKVFYKKSDNRCSAKWLAYGYSFNISCNTNLGWEEIEKIILSLEPINE